MPLEQDKSNGIKLSIKELLNSGLYPELFSRSIPLWKTGNNIIFTQHGVEKIKGWGQLADLSNGEPIRGLLQTIENTEALVFAGDLSTLYRVSATDGSFTPVGSGYALTEDSGAASWDAGAATWDAGASLWDFGTTIAQHWSIVGFGDWQLATYGGTPLIRKGSGTFVNTFVEMAAGAITGITFTSGGTGYEVGDVLTFTGGGGTGATATVISEAGNVITEIVMTTSGSGFTSAPTGHTNNPTAAATNATFTFTINDIDVTSVDVFKVFGPHIMGFNTSTSSREFIWCDADDPDTWVAASDNLAGQLEIRELTSGIKAVVPLGSQMAVYGTDQMFLVSYLDNDLVFGYQLALEGVGAVSKKSVVPVGRKNYGLSEQGFFVTDGAGFQYIDEPMISNYYQANVNKNQLGKAIAFHDEEQTQIRWYFPTGSVSITGGVSFNYVTNTWSILTSDITAGDERRVSQVPITGTSTGILMFENSGTTANGVALDSFVQTKPLDFDNADIIKELDSLRVGFIGLGLNYQIGWSETETGSISWQTAVPLTEGFDFYNLRTAGRWLHFKLYSDTLSADWEVADVEFIGRLEGTR